jgi:hypothetical protein
MWRPAPGKLHLLAMLSACQLAKADIVGDVHANKQEKRAGASGARAFFGKTLARSSKARYDAASLRT